MGLKPDGSLDWKVIIGLITLVSGGVWWGATLSTNSAAHEAQIQTLQTSFTAQMSGIQSTLTSQETLIQSESVLLSKLGQKLDDLQAALSNPRPAK